MFRQAYTKIRMFLGLGKNKPVEVEVMMTKEVVDYMNSLPAEEQARMLNVRGPDLGPDTTTISVRSVTRDHPQLGKPGQGSHLGQMSFNPEIRPLTPLNQQVDEVVDSVRDAFYGRTKPTGTDEEIIQLSTLIPRGPWNRQKPTQDGGNALPLHNSHWKPGQAIIRPTDRRVLTGEISPTDPMETILTGEQLEEYLRGKLTPRLVINNNVSIPVYAEKEPMPMSPLLKSMLENQWGPEMSLGVEPELVDPSNRRRINEAWLHWCTTTHGISMAQAWEVGAKSLIDNEFAHGTMRKNVEILPWDVMNPLWVLIKYHDPQNTDDPWFEKDEE